MNSRTVVIILGFVLLVLALFFLAPGILNLVYAPIPFSAPEAQLVEDAIACSYWRCIEGCGSTHITDTPLLACRTEFCNASYTDTKTKNGKICDDNARTHPVVVDTAGSGLGQTVSQNVLAGLTSSQGEQMNTIPFYIAPSGDNCADQGWVHVAYIDNTKVIQPISKAGCISSELGGPNLCYNEIEMDYGKYYIWTALNNFGVDYNTIVCSTSPATSTTTTTIGCGDAGGICRLSNCQTSEEPIQGTCYSNPRNVNAVYVCCKAKS